MNTLKIDSSKYTLEDYDGNIILTKDTILIVSGNCEIYLTNINYNITFLVNDNSNILINMFSNTKNNNSTIKITQNNNSKFKLVNSYENNDTLLDNYYSEINGNNNICDLEIKVLGKKDVYIKAVVDAKPNTFNNELTESIKAYQCGGIVSISPVLLVGTNEVIANHKAVITNLKNEDMFYLNSKGIDSINAEKIIKESFILRSYTNYFKEKIRKEIYE